MEHQESCPSMIPRLTTANENHREPEGTTSVVPSRNHRSPKVRIFNHRVMAPSEADKTLREYLARAPVL